MTSSVSAPAAADSPHARHRGTPTAYLTARRVGRRLWRVEEAGTRTSVAVLEVIRLNHKEWRISDTTRDDGDPLRLLGYIERLARDQYEVLWLVPPLGWSYVNTYWRALTALADRSRFDGEIVARRASSLD